jgi:DNA-binding NarL/FixJ family response regulator
MVMRVLLVDAYPMVRAALTGLVEKHFPQAQVESVDTVDAARAAMAGALPRLVLLDLAVAGGFELLQQVHRQHAQLPVVIVSGTDDTEDALQALGAGAMGYVPARSDVSSLVDAVTVVLTGGTYVPPLQPLGEAAPRAAAPQAVTSDALDDLPITPRQRMVLRLLVEGLTNKAIARELALSVDTVKDHIAAVYKVLGVNSRTQAAMTAAQLARR